VVEGVKKVGEKGSRKRFEEGKRRGEKEEKKKRRRGRNSRRIRRKANWADEKGHAPGKRSRALPWRS
jgi:hypothetical protein